MKKFLSVVVVVKNGACLCFAAWVAIWGVLALAFWPGASLRGGQLVDRLFTVAMLCAREGAQAFLCGAHHAVCGRAVSCAGGLRLFSKVVPA